MSRHRDYQMRRYYGLTVMAADALIKGAGNRCMICRKRERGMRLSIDHCHLTGIVRGVLCRACNTVLGAMADDPKLLRRAADYLEKAGRRVSIRPRPNARSKVRVVRQTKRRRKAALPRAQTTNRGSRKGASRT